jgi:excinuclease ABC subunit B
MLVAILDADKEGYLRSRVSLIQTIGRAARNVDGRAVLYADRITKSMQAALDETGRRRDKQLIYNAEHGITPESVKKNISNILRSDYERADHLNIARIPGTDDFMAPDEIKKRIKELDVKMRSAAAELEFEKAAKIRDEIRTLEVMDLGLTTVRR